MQGWAAGSALSRRYLLRSFKVMASKRAEYLTLLG